MRAAWIASMICASCSFQGATANRNAPGDGTRREAGAPGSDGPADGRLDAPADAHLLDVRGDGHIATCAANTGTPHDFDGDGIDDKCDKCPQFADPADPDTDGDGVGDPCDPRPTLSGDHVVLFDAFYSSDDVTAFYPSGTWTLQAGGGIAQTATGGSQDYLSYNTDFTSPVYAMTAVTVTTFASGTPMTPTVTLSAGATGGTSHNDCDLLRMANNDELAVKNFWGTSSTATNATAWGGGIVGTDVLLTNQIGSTASTCTATVMSTKAQVAANTAATTGYVTLITSYAAAKFDYLFIVTIGS
jgi:acyl dehydratase